MAHTPEQNERYILYLRLIDATIAGASREEMAMVLFPSHSVKEGLHLVDINMKKAMRCMADPWDAATHPEKYM